MLGLVERNMAIPTTLDIPNGIITENRYKCLASAARSAGSFCPAPCQPRYFFFGAWGMFGDDGVVCEGVMDDNGVVI